MLTNGLINPTTTSCDSYSKLLATLIRELTSAEVGLHGSIHSFVYYKQRIKRMIITSGYNVYPEQIEEAIENNSSVLVSSVVGIPNKEKGEIPVAFIVTVTSVFLKPL